MSETKPCGTCKLATMCIGESLKAVRRQVSMCPHCGDIFWMKSVFYGAIPTIDYVLRGNQMSVCREMRDKLNKSEFSYPNSPCTKRVCGDAERAIRIERTYPR